MADEPKRATSTRAIYESYNKLISDGKNETDKFKEVQEELNQSFKEQIFSSEKLLELQVENRNNALAQYAEEENIRKSLEKRRDVLSALIEKKEKEGKLTHAEKAALTYINNSLEEVNKSRDLTNEKLTATEAKLIRVRQAQAEETAAVESTLKKRKEQLEIIEAEKKAAAEAGDTQRVEQLKAVEDKAKNEIAILEGKEPETKTFSYAAALVSTGAFEGAVGGAIDAFMPKKNEKKEQDRLKETLNKTRILDDILKQLVDINDNTDENGENDFAGVFDDEKEGGALSEVAGGWDPSEMMSKFEDAIGALAGVLDNYVNAGAQFLAANKGKMNASLYGWNNQENADYFSDFLDKAGSLTAGTLIEQREFLSKITELTTQGIADQVGVSALLSTIADKTIPQFNATNSYVRRLVILGEKSAAQRYFGLESIIQASLNKQFGESSYLNALFDSVNSNLTDAITNLSGMLSVSSGSQYEFLSTTQAWLSALYESGVDSSTINRMSSVINSLGSGNVAAMSSDAGMQKLTLLALDRANQDYATILQEGLSSGTVNALLENMVGYLKSIATQTRDNNVLESAYSNLFGLSMTDMYALSNFDFSKVAVGGNTVSELNAEVETRLNQIKGDAYTVFSEKVDNLLSNLQFSFGLDMANSTKSYALWKGGKLAFDIGGALEEAPVIGHMAKLAKAAGAVSMGVSTISPLIGMVVDVAQSLSDNLKGEGNSVAQLYKAMGGTISGESKAAESTFKTLYTDENSGMRSKQTAFSNEYKIEESDVNEEMNAEDPALTILKEFETALMANKAGKKAFAVSLQAMSDEVLRSFASIFADEESMTDIFDDTKKGKKAKNKLFDYIEEKDSADGGKKDGSKTTTGSN